MIMETLIIMFFIIAVLYSIAGFGGGSSYIALLAIFTIPYQLIPPIALICNIIVVTNGSYHFIKGKHLSLNLLLPFIITSIPMAYLGGSIVMDKTFLLILLSVSLLLAGFRMLLIKEHKNYSVELINNKKLWIGGLTIGAFLGGLSGMVGIGGGIFLAPILYFLKWGKPKQVAATCSLFILINSISGLVGQLQKHSDFFFLKNYFLLFVVVLIGGQIGSFLTSHKFSQLTVRKATALLILFASTRIFLKVLINV